MIRNFKHKGLERLYLSGSAKGINPAHARRIMVRIEALDAAVSLEDLPTEWKCHPLHKELEGFYSIRLSGAWRIIFRFEDGNVSDVDYVQYHG